MTLSKKKTITIALALADDRLLSRAARERGVSRSEFIRRHIARVLEQYLCVATIRSDYPAG